MSYILEALRKVEQKRGQEESPGALTFSGEPELERRKRAIWPYLLVVALFLNVLLLVYWLGLLRPGERVGSQSPVALEPSVPVTPTKTGSERPTGADPTKNRQKEDLQTNRSARSVSSAVLEQDVPETSLPAARNTPAAADTAAEPQVHTEKRPAPAAKVYNLDELPPSIRSVLPEFKVSGHAYSSERHTRVARINEKILQEGQELASGLKVEEIVQEGIILNYQGYRFRIGIGQSR